MKRIAIATNVVWTLNFLAAFGVFLFAFVYVIFLPPKKKTNYAQQEAVVRPAPKDKTGNEDRGRYAPIWAMRPGDVTVKPTAGASGLETKVEIAGLMKAKERKNSIAFVNILSGGEQQRVKEGDSVLGARVKEIRANSVVFDDGGREIELFTKRAALTVGDKRKPTGREIPDAPGEFKTKKSGETADRVDWDLDPRELEYASANVDSIMSEMKLRPYAVEGGEMAGLQIEELTPGGFAAERGFLKGDIVKSVEGQPLTSLDEVKKMAASPEMQKKGQITISIERAGRKVDMVFKVGK